MSAPEERTVVVPPVTSSVGGSSHDNNPNPTTTATGDDATIDGKPHENLVKSWKPKFNRQQSWSTQDMKHELQQRQLHMESDNQPGYTEAAANP